MYEVDVISAYWNVHHISIKYMPFYKCDKNFKQSVLDYIQKSTVQIHLSRTGCVSSVFYLLV